MGAPKIKIFLSYHKPSITLESDIMQPIHVGAILSGTKLDMQRDDEGNHISHQNDKYCELTAQYWAWKNADADYYGFMHYRRHFVFTDVCDKAAEIGFIICDAITDEYIEHFGIYDEAIQKKVIGYDVIIPYDVDISQLGSITNEQQFSSIAFQYAVDLETAFSTLIALYPEYAADLDTFRKDDKQFFCNMFIMKKELFFDYCQWLFRILFAAEEKMDFRGYDKTELRAVAMIAERLLNIYILHLKRCSPKYKIGHLKTTFVKCTESAEAIMPLFNKKNIPIAVSCDDNYMPYLGVMLNSLLENASRDRNFDIIVMQSGKVKNEEKHSQFVRILKEIVSQYGNAGIRFENVSHLVSDINLPLTAHFSVETYFRLFLAQLLPHYNKVIYLDADMIVCGDISRLYDIDLDGKALGAAHDPIMSGSEKCPFYNKGVYVKSLGIRDIHSYFQAGVLLIDLDKLKKDSLDKRMIEYASTHNCEYVDQDVLNVFCEGNVKYLDLRWNVEITPNIMEIAKYCPLSLWEDYQKARKEAYIFHFAGVDKPWRDPSIDFADVFWQYAKKTPFYEHLLCELIKSVIYSPSLQAITTLFQEDNQILSPIGKSHHEMLALGSNKKVTEKILEDAKKDETILKKIDEANFLMFYGAGVKCRELLLYFNELDMNFPKLIWDQTARKGKRLLGVPVLQPDFAAMLGKNENTLCVITISSKDISQKVKEQFAGNGFDNILEYGEVIGLLTRKLWLKLEREAKVGGK